MWIENKDGGLVGPARIGWVAVKDRGKRLEYGGKVFRSLNGRGFKSNFYDMATGEEYWISGCRKDGRDALYNTDAEIDSDALQEYWVNIRDRPEDLHIVKIRALGKNK